LSRNHQAMQPLLTWRAPPLRLTAAQKPPAVPTDARTPATAVAAVWEFCKALTAVSRSAVQAPALCTGMRRQCHPSSLGAPPLRLGAAKKSTGGSHGCKDLYRGFGSSLGILQGPAGGQQVCGASTCSIFRDHHAMPPLLTGDSAPAPGSCEKHHRRFPSMPGALPRLWQQFGNFPGPWRRSAGPRCKHLLYVQECAGNATPPHWELRPCA
jgi:hypothetical protein